MTYLEYSKLAIDRIESILTNLNIEYRIKEKNIDICCPIHQGDTLGNSVIYLNEPYVWVCFSGNCHQDYGKNVLGLIKGTLKTLGKDHEWKDIIKFIDGDHKVCPVQKIKQDTPELIRDESHLPEITIPSKYYINLDFKPEILIKYGVGDCKIFPYKYKAIVPIRYIDSGYMGFSARSHYKKCSKCELHHSIYESCIPKNHEFACMFKKWYHSKGLLKSKTLYGIEKIKNTNKIAIVEGPSCVWKLDEFDIPSVACLGKNFSNDQYALLKQIGIEKILFLSDQDAAGLEFRNRFVNDYHKKFNIFFSRLTAKDPSEMQNLDIQNTILEIWNKI